jgi:hypothetical protein
MLKAHKNYMWPRLVTVNDLYAFDPNAVVTIDPFIDIIGRQFKQPKEGLGFDNSPVAHKWRTISTPDKEGGTGGPSRRHRKPRKIGWPKRTPNWRPGRATGSIGRRAAGGVPAGEGAG